MNFFAKALSIGLAALFLSGNAANALILLEDDFNDGMLDTSKWVAVGDAQEVNGRLEVRNAGLLRTLQQFDPIALGKPIRISGEFTNLAGFWQDALIVKTRSNGVAERTGVVPFEVNGIFGVNSANDLAAGTLQIREVLGVGKPPLARARVPDPVPGIGDTVKFVFTDDGLNITWSIMDQSGVPLASIAAQSPVDFALDYISFQNREFSDNLAAFDNLKVELVPVPATIIPAIALLMAGAGWLRRSKR